MYQMIILFTVSILITACADSNSDSIYNPDTGHPDGWIITHGSTFLADPGRCTECHGQDLRGGISKVSCFSASFDGLSCHASGPPGHPRPWGNPDDHGPSAKTTPGSRSGFSYCQICHGSDFSGGIVNQSCFPCHGVSAPHSRSPWKDGRTHINTDGGNASVCAQCHRNDPINPNPAPPGTPPGCFNSTLCHGGIHPDGWATDHALTARIDASSCGTSTCHGTDFQGGATRISCDRCHLGFTAPPTGFGIMHPNRWTDPENSHPDYLEARGNDATSCSPSAPSGVNVAQYCHGQGLPNDQGQIILTPNVSWSIAPNCYACHGKEWVRP